MSFSKNNRFLPQLPANVNELSANDVVTADWLTASNFSRTVISYLSSQVLTIILML